MSRFRSPVAKVLIVASLALFVVLWGAMIWTAFEHDAVPLTTLDPQGPFSTMIDDLVAPVFIIGGMVFVGVLGAVMYFVLRYREKGDDDLELPKQTHGHTAAEVAWTIAPGIVLAVVAFLTVGVILDLSAEEEGALRVEVYGAQWWWGYNYDITGDRSFDSDGDISTANELVIPVGRPVELRITSMDVIHSFWIPALNGKADAVPGMHRDWKIQADAPGVYRGQCTEFCGLSHANMRMLVRAIPADEFDEWVARQQQPAADPPADNELAVAGQEQFVNLCASCHLVDGLNNEQIAQLHEDDEFPLVAGVAPDLTHFRSRGTFAGGIYNLTYPNPAGDDSPFGATCTLEDLENCGDPTDIGLAGNPDNPLYRPFIEDWLRNPPAMKPMAAEEGRGMPNLNLTQEQIDQLVAYLDTLR
ncbi:MAG: cytochrome c oxidase subunit II [Acidimicrobiia bacterium]|nr:cytochrome c oxidase subunit II [Acidimicrobiia bacterium]